MTNPGPMRYMPSPQPAGGLEQVRVWCQREFERISQAMKEGASESLRLDLLQKLPAKPYDGLVCYLAGGVVTGGSAKGLWLYNDGTWTKL